MLWCTAVNPFKGCFLSLSLQSYDTDSFALETRYHIFHLLLCILFCTVFKHDSTNAWQPCHWPLLCQLSLPLSEESTVGYLNIYTAHPEELLWCDWHTLHGFQCWSGVFSTFPHLTDLALPQVFSETLICSLIHGDKAHPFIFLQSHGAQFHCLFCFQAFYSP